MENTEVTYFRSEDVTQFYKATPIVSGVEVESYSSSSTALEIETYTAAYWQEFSRGLVPTTQVQYDQLQAVYMEA